MFELTSDTFHSEAQGSSFLLCIFYQHSANKPEEIWFRIFGNEYETMPVTIAYIDTDKSPDIARMFGVDTKEPTVLIMREQIVLYCEPLSLLGKHDVFSLIEQSSELDMEKIKSKIEIEKQNRAHLFGRRVCPTAKRIREN